MTLSPGLLLEADELSLIASAAVVQKVRNLDDVCLVGKCVRYTNITPVIYFALQTLNNKKFYFTNLILRKEGLSLNFLT